MRKAERNTLRFHWVKSLDSKKIKVLIFTRLVLDLTKSPFISEKTLKSHFEIYRHKFEEIVNRNGKESVELFQKGGFILNKCNSNVSALENYNVDAESELTYAKQVCSHDESETKVISLGWNKSSDKIFVVIPSAIKKRK